MHSSRRGGDLARLGFTSARFGRLTSSGPHHNGPGTQRSPPPTPPRSAFAYSSAYADAYADAFLLLFFLVESLPLRRHLCVLRVGFVGVVHPVDGLDDGGDDVAEVPGDPLDVSGGECACDGFF